MKIIKIILLLISVNVAAIEKTTFLFTNDPIDVVIPCHQKDIVTLDLCIDGIKKNCENIGRVIVVSNQRFTDQAEWFDEALFPFSFDDIFNNNIKYKKIVNGIIPNKSGWIYQQLLKFYTSFVIPDISPNILVLDADTIFLHPVSFQKEDGSGLYHPTSKHASLRHFSPYKRFAEKLIPGLKLIIPNNGGVCHHMLFQRPVLEEIFQIVESESKLPFWKAYSKDPIYHMLSRGELPSEYELYFLYVFARTDQVGFRSLKWKDDPDLKKIEQFRGEGYHFVSFHSYLRKGKTLFMK